MKIIRTLKREDQEAQKTAKAMSPEPATLGLRESDAVPMLMGENLEYFI